MQTFETVSEERQAFAIDRLGYLYCGGCLERTPEGTEIRYTRPGSTGQVERDDVCDKCGASREDWPLTEIQGTARVEHVACKIF